MAIQPNSLGVLNIFPTHFMLNLELKELVLLENVPHMITVFSVLY